MSAIIKINKKKYIIGIDAWLNLESHKKATKMAREKAASLKYEGFTFRPSPVPQIGIIKKWDKNIKGSPYSLATAIAGAKPESWAGLFALPNGIWWSLSIFNGVITSKGDFAGNEDETREVFENQVSKLPSTVEPLEIIDPEEAMKWLKDNISDRYLSRLVKTKNNNMVIGTFTFIAATALLSGIYYHDNKMQSEKELKMNEKLLQQKINEKNNVKPVIIPKPWKNSINYNEFMQDVRTVFYTTKKSVFGWNFDRFYCENTSCSITWSRASGASLQLRPNGIVQKNDNTIVQTVPFTVNNAEGSVGNPTVNYINKFIGWYQLNGIDGQVYQQSNNSYYQNLRSTNQNLRSANQNIKQKPKSYPFYNFRLKLPIKPWSLNLNLPGLVPVSLSWSQGGNWVVKGVIYAPLNQ
jgi:hypothetical protein